MALGYMRLGENPSGVGGVRKWNTDSAAGKKGPVRAWGIKGNAFSAPGDLALAKAVYAFQHSKQCGGPEGQAAMAIDPLSPGHRANCVNRDGMIGNKTMCMIVKAIHSNAPYWGDFWRARIDVKGNMALYQGSAECRLLCKDVACSRKVAAGCPACPRPGPGPTPPRPRPTPPRPRPPGVKKAIPWGLIAGGVVVTGLLAWAFWPDDTGS